MESDIYKMTEDDLDEAMTIENVSFPLPWPLRFFIEELAKPTTRAYVARARNDDKTLLGYIVNTLVLDELHILNVAANPSCRRMGISTALIERSISANPEVRMAFLEVREHNAPARSLYAKLGFKMIGRRKRYYDNGEDAITMMWVS